MEYPSSCVRWTDKLALRIDELASDDQIALQRHLEMCPDCAAQRAGYQRVDADIQSLNSAFHPPDMLPHLLEVRRQHALEEERHATKKDMFLWASRHVWNNLVAKRLCIVGKGLLIWATTVLQIIVRFCSIQLALFGIKSARAFAERRCLRAKIRKIRDDVSPRLVNMSIEKVSKGKTVLCQAAPSKDKADWNVRPRGEPSTEKMHFLDLATFYPEQSSIQGKELYDAEVMSVFPRRNIGPYYLVFDLGSSIFGQSYVAKDAIHANKFVVLKLLHLKSYSQMERKQYTWEAQAFKYLKHPNILPLREVHTDEEQPYLVRDYAPNGSLRAMMRTPVEVGEALALLFQIAYALQRMHDRYIVHQNLKPENILFGARYEVLLCDFGMTTFHKNTFLGTEHGRDTELAFTYMAPEHFEGETSRRSDQYALGCIAYELLTGAPPFKVTLTPDGKMQRWPDQPQPLAKINPQVPQSIEQAILTTLAKDRANRYPNIQTFLTLLLTAMRSLVGEKDFYAAVVFLEKWLDTQKYAFQQKEESDVIDIFLYYGREDKTWVSILGKLLQAQGYYPWLDELNMQLEPQKCSTVARQIAHSKAVAYCIGRQNFSPGQHGIVESLLNEINSKGRPVIPILLPNAPEKLDLPTALKGKPSVDLREQSPDAIDHLLMIAGLEGSS